MTSAPVNGSDDEPDAVGFAEEPASIGLAPVVGGTTDDATT